MTNSPATIAESSRRTLFAVIVSICVLAVAVSAGLAAPPTGGSPVIFIDRISSVITNALSGLGGRLLFAYAFVLGAATVFNPCGFGLIPAYLGLYLGDVTDSPARGSARVRRSLKVGIAVAVAFTVVFGVTGALFRVATTTIIGAMPWLGLIVGILLVVAGATMLAGRPITLRTSERAADVIGQRAGGSGVRAYTAFGLAYALASLGCSFPLFFALVGASMATGTALTAIAAFALFGFGMATVLGLLAVLAGAAGVQIVRRGRRLTRVIAQVGAVLVVMSGGYVVYYWLSAGRLLFG
jgi:cytochrome c biogenesis protein CcdA